MEIREFRIADYEDVIMLWSRAGLLIDPKNASVKGFYQRRGYAADELMFMEKWLV
jgi:hypothetical protein